MCCVVLAFFCDVADMFHDSILTVCVCVVVAVVAVVAYLFSCS